MKSALWLSVGKIVDEETIKLGVNATPQFIGALTEMVWAQIGRFNVYTTNSQTILHAVHSLHGGFRHVSITVTCS